MKLTNRTSSPFAILAPSAQTTLIFGLFQRQRPFTEKQEQEEKEVKEGIEEKKSVLQLHVPLLFMSPQY